MADEQRIWDDYLNKGAFAELYRFYAHDLLQYGYRILPDRQQVQDHLQDLFFYLWKNREGLTHVREPRFYLYKSLRNRILRSIESNKNLQSLDFQPTEDSASPWDNPAWMESEHQSALTGKLHAALSRLPARQQEAIQLRYYHGFSTEEIAQIMKINEQSIRNLLFRAILHLRAQMPAVSVTLLLGLPVY